MVCSLELAEVGPELVFLAVVARRLGLFPQEVRLVLAALDVLVADAVILQGTPACHAHAEIMAPCEGSISRLLRCTCNTITN